MEDVEYQRMFEAEEGHWWYAGLHDLVMRYARAERARAGRALSMLDAGCGTGRLCQLLEPLGEVTGCDIHPLALQATERRGIARVLRRDLAADELGDEQFDLITSMDVLYHRLVSNELAALRNLHRALRTGGLLLFQVPAFESLRGTHDVAVHTRRRYRRKQVARMLTGAGFDVEFSTCRLSALFPAALAWRMFSRLTALRASNGNVVSDVAVPPSSAVNRLLLFYLKVENRLIAAGLRLPFGTSVFAVARK
jgi:SAM-dependent methyltransferase